MLGGWQEENGRKKAQEAQKRVVNEARKPGFRFISFLCFLCFFAAIRFLHSTRGGRVYPSLKGRPPRPSRSHIALLFARDLPPVVRISVLRFLDTGLADDARPVAR